ncbi:ABC transporter permease subunit [Halorhodospira neutriphila]|uniref:ABC transporter permease n=1 Tax=Halorhodospira neutriphila TaxID=168379 RepID=A0ABS1E7M8_9GAMM|nr:ABC transporter permease subunit [Halorhodospira neutriphila]MBK1726824.1 ABC transporter permease [Halorhodospira neutriphila]
MMTTIAARELRSMFLSPLAWGVLAVTQLVLGYLFLAAVDRFHRLQPRLAAMDGGPGVTDIVVNSLFSSAGVVLLLITPLLTMRLISGERAEGTLALLRSAPVSVTRIVLGKYLGVLGFLAIVLAVVLLMPLSLYAGTTLDLGQLAASALGLALMAASFAAAGLFMSSLSSQPTVAAVATFGLLLLLWILEWSGNLGGGLQQAVDYLSLMGHYQDLRQGLVNTADIAYYLLFIATFLVLSIRRLDADRLYG